MAERSTITQVVQVGVETVPGTAVAANKRLTALSITPNIRSNIKRFRPQGYKYPTVTALGKEWSEAPFTGVPTYSEIIYLLSSCLGTATLTTPGGGTLSRNWTYNPSSTAEDTPKTYTVEMGSSLRAHRIPYALVTDFTLDFNREDTSLSGGFLGRRIEDGVTLTASPTEISLIPAIGAQFDVYMDTTSGGIGGTKLTRFLGGSFKLQNRFGPLWVVDSSQTSFVTHIEIEPTFEFEMTVEADAQGMGLLTNMRAGDTRFFRVIATGPIIEGAIPYKIQLDFAAKVGASQDFSDEDGVYAIGWTMAGVHDSGWGKSLTAVVTNQATAL